MIEKSQVSKYLLKFKVMGVNGVFKCKQLLITSIIPQSKKYTALGIKVYNEKLAPNINKGSVKIGQELLKIHKKQNWFKRFGFTMMDNSAGLGMAMFSTKIIENFVEVEGFGNLWGLLATHPVVSEATYEVLSFAVEFFVALLAFTLTEHYQEEYRQRKNNDHGNLAE
ncbi:MAG: hypothetical protein OEY66_09100 [Gammaproteobacteria bacterium]|nr:hypothetical protein [Gammaproteobacteria bacterium]